MSDDSNNNEHSASFRARVAKHYEAIRREQQAIEREVRWLGTDTRYNALAAGDMGTTDGTSSNIGGKVMEPYLYKVIFIPEGDELYSLDEAIKKAMNMLSNDNIESGLHIVKIVKHVQIKVTDYK